MLSWLLCLIEAGRSPDCLHLSLKLLPESLCSFAYVGGSTEGIVKGLTLRSCIIQAYTLFLCKLRTADHHMRRSLSLGISLLY